VFKPYFRVKRGNERKRSHILFATTSVTYGNGLAGNMRMHWIDPESLAESTHRVRQFLMNEHGEVEGFVSTHGVQVHVPPHLGEALTSSVSPGELAYVRGVKPRGADVLAAVAIDSIRRERIEDTGPPPKRANGKGFGAGFPSRKHEMEGICERVLFAPRGEPAGVLFTNGMIARFDPEVADDLEEFLKPGTAMNVSGNLRVTPYGSVLDADYFWAADEAQDAQGPHR
jgi:hypothetical protein